MPFAERSYRTVFVELAFLATVAALGYRPHRFLGSLEIEALRLHAELGSLKLSHDLWNDKLLVALAQLVQSRQYWVRLAAHPLSRAWERWLCLVH